MWGEAGHRNRAPSPVWERADSGGSPSRVRGGRLRRSHQNAGSAVYGLPSPCPSPTRERGCRTSVVARVLRFVFRSMVQRDRGGARDAEDPIVCVFGEPCGVPRSAISVRACRSWRAVRVRRGRRRPTLRRRVVGLSLDRHRRLSPTTGARTVVSGGRLWPGLPGAGSRNPPAGADPIPQSRRLASAPLVDGTAAL